MAFYCAVFKGSKCLAKGVFPENADDDRRRVVKRRRGPLYEVGKVIQESGLNLVLRRALSRRGGAQHGSQSEEDGEDTAQKSHSGMLTIVIAS